MRKLSLDRAWKLCIEQWDFVAKFIEADKGNVHEGKTAFLEHRGYKDLPEQECFFCEYNIQNDGISGRVGCRDCPGKLISGGFDCEDHHSYRWNYEPFAFYRKINTLYKRYLKQKTN